MGIFVLAFAATGALFIFGTCALTSLLSGIVSQVQNTNNNDLTGNPAGL